MSGMILAAALPLVLAMTLGAAQTGSTRQARAGWDALNAGRAQDAAAAFAEVLRAGPPDASVLLGAGLADHLLGKPDTARRYLLDALKLEPALTPAALLLGEILYRTNDINGAIGVYEQALTHAPDHRTLLARLETWRKEASLHDRFAQKLGDHFTVLFEGPAEAELAATAVEILEAAYWRIGSTLYTYPTEVIPVILYTREQFRDVTQSPDWAAAAYDGRIRVPVLGAMKHVRELERVLAHELTHAFVRSASPRGVPQWLNEGLAIYFEGSNLAPLIELAESAEKPHPLTTLERPFAGMDETAATLAYAQSAAAVKRLFDEAGPAAIVGLLTDLGRGIPFPEAFERQTNIPYKTFSTRRRP